MGVIGKIRNNLANRAFTLRKKILRRTVIGFGSRPGLAEFEASLNRTQRLFVKWNASRLGISEQESLRRYHYSWNTVAEGHRGARFEIFMFLNQEIFSVFFGNSDQELFATYLFHGYRDLLRQLIFPEPAFTGDHPIVKGLADRQEIEILDFGCGLAQRSRCLAEFLMRQGKKVRVHLVDIPSAETDFLEWVGRNTELDITFSACGMETPIPPLPGCDVIIATEFFEHVSNPLEYFARFDEKLRHGGFLWTDVADHEEGFLHVCPRLADLRQELDRGGYRTIEPNIMFRKN